MKFIAALPLALLLLMANPDSADAMWTAASSAELVEMSDVIIKGKLIGQVRVVISDTKLLLGVLQVDEVLKGEPHQTVVLLALPSREGPRSSSDITYETGQQGVWCLRERETQGTAGIYLADHPQRLLLTDRDADQIQAIRNILTQ